MIGVLKAVTTTDLIRVLKAVATTASTCVGVLKAVTTVSTCDGVLKAVATRPGMS